MNIHDDTAYVPISRDLFREIEQWKLKLCITYSLSDIDMNTFITFLLIRSEVDVSILLWHLEEGLDAFKDFRKLNDN